MSRPMCSSIRAKKVTLPRENITFFSLCSGIHRISNLKVNFSIKAGELHVDSTPDIHVLLKKGLLHKITDSNFKSENDDFVRDVNVYYCGLNEVHKIELPLKETMKSVKSKSTGKSA